MHTTDGARAAAGTPPVGARPAWQHAVSHARCFCSGMHHGVRQQHSCQDVWPSAAASFGLNAPPTWRTPLAAPRARQTGCTAPPAAPPHATASRASAPGRPPAGPGSGGETRHSWAKSGPCRRRRRPPSCRPQGPPIAPHQRPDGSVDAGGTRQRLPVAARETFQPELDGELVEGGPLRLLGTGIGTRQRDGGLHGAAAAGELSRRFQSLGRLARFQRHAPSRRARLLRAMQRIRADSAARPVELLQRWAARCAMMAPLGLACRAGPILPLGVQIHWGIH